MWQHFKRAFKKPVDWLSGVGEEIRVKLRTCPGCDTPKAEESFDLDERFRVLCLECRKEGHKRSAFEAFDDLVKASPPSSAPS